MILPIATNFVSGETAAEAFERVRQLNDSGISAMVNRLGSHYVDRSLVEADVERYRRLVEDISRTDVDAAISVKPTQLGLSIDEELFLDSIDKLVGSAAERGVFVWLDMEEHTTVDATLDAYQSLTSQYGAGIGVCLQASLRRTPTDLERVSKTPGRIRLVKGGAYDEPVGAAYQKKSAINRAYRNVLASAFARRSSGIAVATHDPSMIDYAKSLHREHGTSFEFQMLMGVRTAAQLELTTSYDVCQYVPYGTRWKLWFLNRARNNVGLSIRAVAEALSMRGINSRG